MLTAEKMRASCGGALDGLSDQEIETMGALALEYACAYTGRELEYGEYTQDAPMAGKTALLRAYPIREIKSARVDGADVDISAILVDAARGILTRPHAGETCRAVYSGGYETLPAPIVCALAMLISSISQAGKNAGQQITYQALDGYQVTYASKSAAGDALEMLSPVAAILLRPYRARQAVRGLA